MHAYMSVFVHVCMGIYMYAYMYVKGHVGTYRCNVCACKYIYIFGFVRVCVCVYIYTYMYEKTLCVHVQCVYTNTGIHVCVCILFTDVFYMCV